MPGPIIDGLLTRLHAEKKRPLVIVETGTTFLRQRWPIGSSPENRSTVVIAEWIRTFGGHLHSIDADRGHINICREVLEGF